MRTTGMLAAAAAVVATMAGAGPAHAAPAPFGHACTAGESFQGTFRHCPTVELADRVPSWDGTPIDADVHLPPTGDGPWPTVVWLHGFGDGKEAVPVQAEGYAARGYAALSLSARGFRRSCGAPSSRTPDCARGWMHVADQRFEVRDVQHLLGLLVDQGVTIPDRIGATGSSYAGIQALQLGFLKDRVRLPDGSFAPWRSPAGTPMRVAGVAPQLAWADTVAAMYPNGDFGGPTTAASTATRARPGFRLASFYDLIKNGAQFLNFVAPPGADPTIDFQRWLDLGPDDLARPAGRRALDELYRYRSALAIPGTPAPIIMVQGWTDNAIPVAHALAVYRTLRARDPQAKVWLTLSDFGHWRSMNKSRTIINVGDRNIAFFDRFLRGTKAFYPPGQVTVYRANCARRNSDGAAIRASSYDRLMRGAVTARARGAAGVVTSAGGLAAVANAVDPVASQQHCTTIPARSEPNDATLDLTVRRPFTYLGQGVITARIRGAGGPRGQVAARLWRISRGRQHLIDRSVTRVDLPRAGKVRLTLNGNAIRLRRGERLRVQLLGRDTPTYEAPDRAFRIAVSDLELELPTRERAVRGALAVRPRG